MSDKQDRKPGAGAGAGAAGLGAGAADLGAGATGLGGGPTGRPGGVGGFSQGQAALQQGAEQMRAAAEASARLSQEMIERATQNFEVMRRIGETLGTGARTATQDLSEYVRHTAQRQQEMAQKLAQARTPSDVLDIQTRYFQDNLKELLGLSERLSQTSAEAARQAGQRIGGGDEGPTRS